MFCPLDHSMQDILVTSETDTEPNYLKRKLHAGKIILVVNMLAKCNG